MRLFRRHRPPRRPTGPRRPGVLLIAAALALTLVASCTSVIAGNATRAGIQGTLDEPDSGSGTTSPKDTGSADDGSGGSDAPGPQITVPSTADTGSGTPSDSGALAKYYSQDLDWGDCAPYATTSQDESAYRNAAIECARLTVPMDYSDPDGQTVTIGVLRSKASGDWKGSVVFNPGGPGASGMSIVASIAQYGIDARLHEHYDFVGFDPRGVASSQPAISCQADQQRDEARAANWPGFMPSRTDEEVDAANKVSKQFVKDCIKSISAEGVDGTAFLAQVGTTNVAKDIDVLRAVLGDKKLTYVGWSYGTSIGTQYAEQFPDKVRAMILDGAVDPAVDSATDSLQQTTAFQHAFDDFAAWCADRSGCPWSDASSANSTFQQMAQPLMDHPLTVSDGRPLSFLDATIGVADALYSDATWPALKSALNDLASGDANALMQLADEYNDRDADGHYSNLLEAFTAIRCMDSDRITDPDTVTELNEKLIKAAPFEDNGQPAAAIFDTCAFWPVPPTLTPHTPDVSGLAPVLVVSTTDDPATPYESGVNLAKDLDGALLTVHGTRHTAFMLSGLSCVDKIGNDYLIDLTVPDQGAECS